MIRRSRFGFNYSPGLVQQHESGSERVEVFTPVRGFHRGDSPMDLEVGYSPDMENFDILSGRLKPRSGLSQFKGGASHLSAPALGAFRMNDATGNQFLVTASDRTISLFDPDLDSWSTLSYQKPSTATSLPSGSSRDYWHGAWIYDAAMDRNLGVLTNSVDLPKVFSLAPSVTTYSDLTDFASLASRARSVAVVDNRLCWWNVASSASSYPTRLLWSPRGLPRNYQVADGAGFNDLLDMAGVGTRVVAEREGALLFTTEEIWRARERGDAYVFDFYPITRQLGAPYPNTITRTPIGTIFLGRDLELYLVDGDTVFPLGPSKEGEASRTQGWLNDTLREPERAWSVYNPDKRRFELYFTDTASTEGYPTRALFYHITERSFTVHRFRQELSAGVDFDDTGNPTRWDDFTTETWDDLARAWDSLLNDVGTGYAIHAFSSNGTALRYRSTQTNDDGSNFTAYWTSGALNREDQMRYERVTDLFIEYRAISASSASVLLSPKLDFTSPEVHSISLVSNEYGRAHIPARTLGVSPFFRVQITTGATPEFARFQTKLVDAGIFSVSD